jgi:hypothetical protein
MSESGHFRPNWALRRMSAFPPLETRQRTSLEVRFVPKADMLALAITGIILHTSSSSRALACFKSNVSKPSVNQS